MPIVRTAFAVMVVSLLSSAAVPEGTGCTTGAEIDCIEQRPVRGVIEGRTLAFEGIPYAQAPIRPLRWKPPQPAGTWERARDRTRYGAIFPQSVGREVER